MDLKVKDPKLLTHHIYGIDALHPDARDMLHAIVAYCLSRGWPMPVFTEFGRLRRDQERAYTPTFRKQGLDPDQARQMARDKFSWHNLSMVDGLCRAFDMRTRDPMTGVDLYTDAQCGELVAYAKEHFKGCEALHHAVVGGAAHLHFALPDPKGWPEDWV